MRDEWGQRVSFWWSTLCTFLSLLGAGGVAVAPQVACPGATLPTATLPTSPVGREKAACGAAHTILLILGLCVTRGG